MIGIREAEIIVKKRFGIDLSDTGSTHLPVLVSVLSRTDGDVLELGTGKFSTPVLHEFCEIMGRRLFSYESNKEYYDKVKSLQTKLHSIEYVENFSQASIEQDWSLVFIDHRPADRRVVDIKRVSGYADYIVCHDTEPESDYIYGYSGTFKNFPYRWDYTKFKTHTTVVSTKRIWE